MGAELVKADDENDSCIRPDFKLLPPKSYKDRDRLRVENIISKSKKTKA